MLPVLCPLSSVLCIFRPGRGLLHETDDSAANAKTLSERRGQGSEARGQQKRSPSCCLSSVLCPLSSASFDRVEASFMKRMTAQQTQKPFQEEEARAQRPEV